MNTYLMIFLAVAALGFALWKNERTRLFLFVGTFLLVVKIVDFFSSKAPDKEKTRVLALTHTNSPAQQ